MQYFNQTHPVAKAARILCRDLCGTTARSTGVIGNVACGTHWEQAIRTDERVAVEDDLPPAERDPLLVDEVAVERAMRGDRVPLTPVERLVVNGRLAEAADVDGRVLATATAFHAECLSSELRAA